MLITAYNGRQFMKIFCYVQLLTTAQLQLQDQWLLLEPFSLWRQLYCWQL